MPVKWFNYLSIDSNAPQGLNPAWWLHHRSLARTVKKNAYLLANEWIAANLGWHLRLPIPPFAVMRKTSSTTRYFASLDFGKEIAPSDMKASVFCDNLPVLATGIVAFDILIANHDRHEGNLKVDAADAPTAAELFDHDSALFGRRSGGGNSRMASLEGKLGFSKSGGMTEVHKVASKLRTAKHFDGWMARVDSIPDTFIHELFQEGKDLGLSTEEADYGTDWLCRRKNSIRDIIKANKAFFPIHDWGLFYS